MQQLRHTHYILAKMWSGNDQCSWTVSAAHVQIINVALQSNTSILQLIHKLADSHVSRETALVSVFGWNPIILLLNISTYALYNSYYKGRWILIPIQEYTGAAQQFEK